MRRRFGFAAVVGGFAAYSYVATVVSAAWFLRRDYGAGGPGSLLWAGALFAPWIGVGLLVWAVLRSMGSGRRSMIVLAGSAAPATALCALLSVAVDAAMRGADWDWAARMSAAIDRAPVSILLYTAVAASGLAAEHWRRADVARREVAALRADLERMRSRQAADAGRAAVDERLMVSAGRRRVAVAVNEVEWFAAAANYVVVHWANREGLLRETVAALEGRLAVQGFARAHRSTLVNLTQVRDLAPLSDGAWRVTMNSGAELVVSRSYRDAFLARVRAG